MTRLASGPLSGAKAIPAIRRRSSTNSAARSGPEQPCQRRSWKVGRLSPKHRPGPVRLFADTWREQAESCRGLKESAAAAKKTEHRLHLIKKYSPPVKIINLPHSSSHTQSHYQAAFCLFQTQRVERAKTWGVKAIERKPKTRSRSKSR